MYKRLFGDVMALNRYLRMQYLIPEMSKVANATVLDLGCLDGHFTRYLLGRGNRVHAVDIEENGIRSALPEVIFCLSQGERLPYADNFFDFIFCSDVFEHVENCESIISEISRVLKPGKTCLISTVDGYWDSPVKIRSLLLHYMPVSWQSRLMGRFALSDAELHRSFMGHVRYDLSLEKMTQVFMAFQLQSTMQTCYCYAFGALLMEVFFSFNERIRFFTFPFLRALLPLDRWVKLGKPWQYFMVFRKGEGCFSSASE